MSAASQAQESANEAQIANFLAAKQLTPPQIAGVLGNIEVESTFNTSALSKDTNGLMSGGIVQWNGDRLAAEQKYAAAQGTPWTDLNTQLGYLWQELSGPENASLQALQQTTNVDDAATVFDQKFERSSPKSLPLRVKDAEAIDQGVLGGYTVQTAGWLGDLGNLASGNVGGAIAGVAADTTKAAVGPLVPYIFEGGALLIAGALVTFGLYQAFKPAIHSAAGAAQSAAGNVAKIAAIA